MIKLFKEEQKKLVTIEDQENIFEKIEKNMWIHISDAKYDDINKLSQITKIDKDLLITMMRRRSLPASSTTMSAWR